MVFVVLALLLSRGSLPLQESPVFIAEHRGGVRILLGEGFVAPGVHHFSDGDTVESVINLALRGGQSAIALDGVAANEGLVDGMALAIGDSADSQRKIVQGWMPARQRLALGIPLHPDRMSREDWVSLPGIGEKLAEQIELDRQNYGDYGSLEALARVKGIGPAKLKALQGFFIDKGNYSYF